MAEQKDFPAPRHSLLGVVSGIVVLFVPASVLFHSALGWAMVPMLPVGSLLSMIAVGEADARGKRTFYPILSLIVWASVPIVYVAWLMLRTSERRP